MSTDLAIRSTVRELVATFQQAALEIRAAFAAIVAAEARVNAAFTLGGDNTIHISADRGMYRDDFSDADETIKRMERQAWGCIVERLELRRVMSIERWRQLEEHLKRGELPPITEENVFAFARQYEGSLPDMFAEAVREVFDWLTPQCDEHKTNSKLQVGPRVVRESVVELGWTGKGFRIRYHREQNVAALDRVFHGLDGKGMVSRSYKTALETAIETSPDGRAETEYFEVRCFKNGNLHIRFKRLDLLSRFNRMAGGMRLRPAA